MFETIAAIFSIILLITTLFFHEWLGLVGLILVLIIVIMIIWKLMEE